ncbi:unnamed protein product [Ectocarpus sp. 12 AP-2014]
MLTSHVSLPLQGKYAEVYPLYVRATDILETAFDPDHPQVASSLNNRAVVLADQGKLAEAEALYERAYRIREKVLGSQHPDTGVDLNNLATSLYRQVRATRVSESPQDDSLNWFREKAFEHDDIASSVLSLQGKFEDADTLYVRALELLSTTVGEEDPDYATTLSNRAELFDEQGKHAKTTTLYERSQAIREVLGPEHPGAAQSLHNQAAF